MPGVSKVKSQMDAAGVDENIVTKNEASNIVYDKKREREPKDN